jgi:hypothetical protein
MTEGKTTYSVPVLVLVGFFALMFIKSDTVQHSTTA